MCEETLYIKTWCKNVILGISNVNIMQAFCLCLIQGIGR
jgi:hypothetical protein